MDSCHICDKPLEAWKSSVEVPYHYTESGLSHVWLGGVTVYSCPSCEIASADIPDMDGLHRLISKDLILRPVPMTGEELRFLRKEARKTPKAFADIVEVDPKTVTNWENSPKLSKQIDIALRVILTTELFQDEERAKVFKDLAGLIEYSWEGEEDSLDDEIRRITALTPAPLLGGGASLTWGTT